MSACLLKIASCRQRPGLFSTSLSCFSSQVWWTDCTLLHGKLSPSPFYAHPPAVMSSELELFAPVDHLLMPTHIIQWLILKGLKHELCIFAGAAGRWLSFLSSPEWYSWATFLRALLEIHSSAASRKWESLFCTQVFCCIRERQCKCHRETSSSFFFPPDFKWTFLCRVSRQAKRRDETQKGSGDLRVEQSQVLCKLIVHTVLCRYTLGRSRINACLNLKATFSEKEIRNSSFFFCCLARAKYHNATTVTRINEGQINLAWHVRVDCLLFGGKINAAVSRRGSGPFINQGLGGWCGNDLEGPWWKERGGSPLATMILIYADTY